VAIATGFPDVYDRGTGIRFPASQEAVSAPQCADHVWTTPMNIAVSSLVHSGRSVNLTTHLPLFFLSSIFNDALSIRAISFDDTNMGRSQWPRCLRHELLSLARKLGSWVRIPLMAWMSVCVYSVFMLSCV
jgi:hypothetical protein